MARQLELGEGGEHTPPPGTAAESSSSSSGSSAAIKAPVDDDDRHFSSSAAIREILRLNRQLVKRLDDLESRAAMGGGDEAAAALLWPSVHDERQENGSVKLQLPNGKATGARPQLSSSELKRLVGEQQLTVGVSQPPIQPSVDGVAAAKVAAHRMRQHGAEQSEPGLLPENALLRSMPRSIPPIGADRNQQQAATQQQSAPPRKTPSPPILKQPGGPIVHENAPGIAFRSPSKLVTTKEITPVKPKPRRSSAASALEPEPEPEPEPEAESGGSGWLKGTRKVAPAPGDSAAAAQQHAARTPGTPGAPAPGTPGAPAPPQPTRNRTRVRRQP